MKFVRTIAMWRPVSRPCRRPLSPFEDALRNAVSLGGDSDTLACITGGIAEAFYGMPSELQQETQRMSCSGRTLSAGCDTVSAES